MGFASDQGWSLRGGVVKALLGLGLLSASARGFVRAPAQRFRHVIGTSRVQPGRASALMMLSPSDVVHHLDPAWLSHVIQGVADAAAPVVEEVKKDPSWWDQFVGVVQGSLRTLHGTLQAAGVPYSYGAAIILFTAGLKVALLPITYKQLESSARLQALAPKAKELKKKYGRNKALLNQLTAKLYQEAEVNPLAGCLPALAQIPIFIALYRSLLSLSADSDFNEPFFWLPSLAGPLYGQQRGMSWLTENWVDGHPALGWHDTLCFLSIPLILIITQTISQKLMSPPTDNDDPQSERTQAILKYLPFMVGYFSLSVPAGLGLYWITNNLVTTTISMAVKEKFKQNPITYDVDVDPSDLGYDPSADHVSFDELLEEARRNPKPSRMQKRLNPTPSALAMKSATLNEGTGPSTSVSEVVREKEKVDAM